MMIIADAPYSADPEDFAIFVHRMVAGAVHVHGPLCWCCPIRVGKADFDRYGTQGVVAMVQRQQRLH